MLLKLAIRFWDIISSRRKKQIYILLIIIVVTSIAEFISIGAIVPFLGILMSPEKTSDSRFINFVSEFFEPSRPFDTKILLTLFFCASTLCTAALRILLLWLQNRVGHAIGADVSIRIYERTLYQPYSVHVSRNSSEIITSVTEKVNTLVYSGIFPILTAIGSLWIIASLVLALFLINTKIAIIYLGGFGFLYWAISASARKTLATNSLRIGYLSNKVVKILQEGLGGIRDVLIDGSQPIYVNAFRAADEPLRKARANNQIIATAPRYLIEALGILVIVGITYVAPAKDGEMTSPFSMLGAFALASQRLFPVLQQLYMALASYRGEMASLKDVMDLLEQPSPKNMKSELIQTLQFTKSIKLVDLSFRYSHKTPWILNGANLEIPLGARVGFIGKTGGGKSTLLDIIMGLLPVQDGILSIDDIHINHTNLRAWQKNIAHVPQSIFLSDTSILENIALGVENKYVDFPRLHEAVSKAELKYVVDNLSDGLETLVGERGVQLSGGQRQRIGIARALYKSPKVLILDEATNALDDHTEAAIMKSICSIERNVTILMVAHRISSLKFCDVVYEVIEGRVEKKNPF